MTSVKKCWNDEAVFLCCLQRSSWKPGIGGGGALRDDTGNSSWQVHFGRRGERLFEGRFLKNIVQLFHSRKVRRKEKERKNKKKEPVKHRGWGHDLRLLKLDRLSYWPSKRQFYISFGNWVMILIVLQNGFSFPTIYKHKRKRSIICHNLSLRFKHPLFSLIWKILAKILFWFQASFQKCDSI